MPLILADLPNNDRKVLVIDKDEMGKEEVAMTDEVRVC